MTPWDYPAVSATKSKIQASRGLRRYLPDDETPLWGLIEIIADQINAGQISGASHERSKKR
jgi:hypothetical protein